MFKKIILGILVLTVVASAAAAAAYNFSKSQNSPVVAEESFTAQDMSASNNNANNIPHQASPQPASAEMMGEPFSALAQILGFDATGMDVVLETGEPAYIELGPEEFWRSQNVELRETDIVTIEGTINEDMYHATSVTTAAGDILILRGEDGQPLWSGSVTKGQGQGGSTQNSYTGPQVAPEAWITYTGTLTAITNGGMTIELEDGISISFRTGQPRFFRSQGVNFVLGEQIQVVGFETEGNFSAGDITQLSTGIRVMLLDPNGRPLWAGPGNSSGAPLPTDTPTN
jgi:hypothetical protein